MAFSPNPANPVKNLRICPSTLLRTVSLSNGWSNNFDQFYKIRHTCDIQFNVINLRLGVIHEVRCLLHQCLQRDLSKRDADPNQAGTATVTRPTTILSLKSTRMHAGGICFFEFGFKIVNGLFVGWVKHPDIFCWVSFLYPTYLPAIFVLSAKPNKMAYFRG